MKAIPHLQGYFADRRGSIWSTLPSPANHGKKPPYRMKVWIDEEGYEHATLRFKGKGKRFPVHRLVASTFLGPCPDGCVCSHKNGNPGDNRAVNLEYISQRENIHKKATHGTMVRGELQYRAKLKPSDVMTIREMCASGAATDADIAKRFGINPATVHSIKTGRTWKHLPLVAAKVPKVSAGDPVYFKPTGDTGPRPIPGFDGYRAGMDGSIWCFVQMGRRNRWPIPRQLKTFVNQDGYPEVGIRRGKRRYTHVAVHRLVALAWLGLRPAGYVVHHLNGDRTDARAINLCYVSPRHNVIAKRGHGTMRTGEANHLSTLTADEVREIRRMVRSKKHTSRSIAKRFGVTQSTVWSIKTGRAWQHLKESEIESWQTHGIRPATG